jgi:predicted ATPase
MHELDTITVRGFKSIAAIEALKLGPINVLIGPNGSGKSNFIGVFSFLHALREGHLRTYVARAGGADRILHFGSKVTPELYIHLSFGSGINQYEITLERAEYEITLERAEEDRLFPLSETVYIWDRSCPQPSNVRLAPRGSEAGIGNPGLTRSGPGRHLRDHLASWRVYHFHDTGDSSPMKKTADVHDNRYLRPDAANLAPFLYLLREKHPSSYTLILRTVQLMAPFFDDFLLEPQRLNPETMRLEWRHKGSEAYFNATSLSDGTLRFIALATLFLQPVEYRPSVILVDEPELGLHPYAITLLASLVKQASVHTQVVLSTQAPQLLDHFEPQDVLVADRVDGGTQLRRLEAEPLAAWLEEYSLGQLWEKNELGGRPSAERVRG